LFARLFAALRPSARLVLVGDPHQLVSVEAGAVLGDVVGDAGSVPLRTTARAAELAAVAPGDPTPTTDRCTRGTALRDGIALLTTPRRYSGAGPLDALARAVRGDDADAALEVLRGSSAIRFVEIDDEAAPTRLLRTELLPGARELIARAEAGDHLGALAVVERHRLLCAHREGPRGVGHWERQVLAWLRSEHRVAPRRDGHYPGQPLLVTANDPDNGLWNGDTGVVVAEADGLPVAWFATGAEPIRVPLSRLGEVRPLYAMTVHRGQGSQYHSVTVLLPPATSPLGTRETLYTAVTRAQQELLVIGSESAVRAAIANRAGRASGLRERLA
jgi:exodeoxyribonuclease V alpha subunit